MSKHVSPKFKSQYFHCPFCNIHSQMVWEDAKFNIFKCVCCQCDTISYWLVTKYSPNGPSIGGKMIYPKVSTAPYPHDDMPEDIKLDYLEARNIVNDSPRGASALLRLAIQKLCVHLGGKGKKIDDDIKSLIAKGLPTEIQKSLDIVRVTGNNSVHPGNLNSDDVKDIALKLFDLVNFIVAETITRPKEIEELYFKIVPENVRESREKISLEKEREEEERS